MGLQAERAEGAMTPRTPRRDWKQWVCSGGLRELPFMTFLTPFPTGAWRGMVSSLPGPL